MTARIVHFEVAGRNGDALEHFYAELFDWKINRESPAGHTYGRIDLAKSGELTGGIRHEPQGKAEVVFYVEVPDLPDAVGRAKELGGSVRIPPMDFDGMKFALLQDPAGNPVGLIEAAS